MVVAALLRVKNILMRENYLWVFSKVSVLLSDQLKYRVEVFLCKRRNIT